MRYRSIERGFVYILLRPISLISMKKATRLYAFFLNRWGVKIDGSPNFIASSCRIDSSNFASVKIGEGVTISEDVQFLTHDWAPHTVGHAMGIFTSEPIGRSLGIEVGAHSFIGMRSMLLPGCRVGRGCIVGAAAVVRGDIPDFSIVMGNPGTVTGDTRAYIAKRFPQFASSMNDFTSARAMPDGGIDPTNPAQPA